MKTIWKLNKLANSNPSILKLQGLGYRNAAGLPSALSSSVAPPRGQMGQHGVSRVPPQRGLEMANLST